jgi:hypothetical protein
MRATLATRAGDVLMRHNRRALRRLADFKEADFKEAVGRALRR